MGKGKRNARNKVRRPNKAASKSTTTIDATPTEPTPESVLTTPPRSTAPSIEDRQPLGPAGSGGEDSKSVKDLVTVDSAKPESDGFNGDNIQSVEGPTHELESVESGENEDSLGGSVDQSFTHEDSTLEGSAAQILIDEDSTKSKDGEAHDGESEEKRLEEKESTNAQTQPPNADETTGTVELTEFDDEDEIEISKNIKEGDEEKEERTIEVKDIEESEIEEVGRMQEEVENMEEPEIEELGHMEKEDMAELERVGVGHMEDEGETEEIPIASEESTESSSENLDSGDINIKATSESSELGDIEENSALEQETTLPVQDTPNEPSYADVLKQPNSEGSSDASDLEKISQQIGDTVGEGKDIEEEIGEDSQTLPERKPLVQVEPKYDIEVEKSPEAKEIESIQQNECGISLQSTQITPEIQELNHIKLKEGDFGYNIGRGEESGRIRPDEDSTENPGASRARRASVQSESDTREELATGEDNPMEECRPNVEADIELPTSEPLQKHYSTHTPPSRDNINTEEDTTNDLPQVCQQNPLDVTSSPKPYNSQATEITASITASHDIEIPESENHHKTDESQEQLLSNDQAEVTLDQLQEALGEFKEILNSAEPHKLCLDGSEAEKQKLSVNAPQLVDQLGKMESEINVIRKQISAHNISSTSSGDTTPRQEFISSNHTELPDAIRDDSGGAGRKVNWSMIGSGVVAALGLLALGSMVGPITRQGRGLADKLAELLFKEGKAQLGGR